MSKASAKLIVSCSAMFKGNTHGSNQRQGILNGKQVYLMQPLMGGEPLCFDVPASRGPMRKDGMLYLFYVCPTVPFAQHPPATHAQANTEAALKAFAYTSRSIVVE